MSNVLQALDEAPPADEDRLINAPDGGLDGGLDPGVLPPAPVPMDKSAGSCPHPVKPKSKLLAKDLDFGLRVRVNWESSTGNLADLAGVFVTESITYSKIPNPPFGKSDGKELPESGKTQRIPSGDGLKAEVGVAQDTHRHPRSLVRSPASTDSYTVTQTYDYRGGKCGSTWTPFANYVITYSIVSGSGGGLRFKTNKVGTDGPFDSDEAI